MKIRIVFALGVSFYSIMRAAPQASPGTSLWTVVNQTQDLVHDTSLLVDSLSQNVVNINNKEDELTSLVDYISRESARRIDRVFNQAEEIRAIASSRLDAVINYVQYVAVESARRIDNVLDRTNELTIASTMHHEDIKTETIILRSLIDELALQTVHIESALVEVRNNQENIQSTLALVRQNGVLAAQALNGMSNNNRIFNSKLDAISSELDSCCTELNDNDAKIFSAVERLDTKLVVGINSIHEQLNTRSINTHTVCALQDVIFISQHHVGDEDSFVISQPGCYKLIEPIIIAQGTGICIQAENVVFDLGGHSIICQDDKVFSLHVDQSKTVTIKNGTVVGGQGLSITDSEGVTIDHMCIAYAMASGIGFRNVQGFFVTESCIRNSSLNGVLIDAQSSNGIIQETRVADCTQSGFVLQGRCVLVEDSVAQHNGEHGIMVAGGHDIQVNKSSAEANNGNGIVVTVDSERIQVGSCRVLGNGQVGCVDGGATQVLWVNNLSSGNKFDDYSNIRAVSQTKATSYWHNVYGS